ncbi:hypothetical protein OVY01_12730 [Robbsia sp. Bb-Pol-6]|uniref:Tetratricopeptide repeat protein n=1 Tax=Robbsia betulipollinis TaxID=2981849 RepID=A0ABT3ZNG2_9BURK|nr:hypothetical protein [Robbsia betulipollinis]MCY0388086.1 hypothetical protein [Robbsia betulipollinis]
MMRFAGLATAFALAACALPPAEENGDAEQRRERAQRHGRLALAYLSHRRPGIAREEAAAALALAPGDPEALHAAALVELAAGRLPAALPYLAAAAREAMAMPGWRDDPRAGAILSNYSVALCDAGRIGEARRWRERAAAVDRAAAGTGRNRAPGWCGADRATHEEADGGS